MYPQLEDGSAAELQAGLRTRTAPSSSRPRRRGVPDTIPSCPIGGLKNEGVRSTCGIRLRASVSRLFKGSLRLNESRLGESAPQLQDSSLHYFEISLHRLDDGSHRGHAFTPNRVSQRSASGLPRTDRWGEIPSEEFSCSHPASSCLALLQAGWPTAGAPPGIAPAPSRPRGASVLRLTSGSCDLPTPGVPEAASRSALPSRGHRPCSE